MTAKYGIDGCYEIDADGCWIWQMYIDHRGYGTVRREGRKWGAHRYAYTFFVGPIPGDMTVDHLCFKPACVNPQHLRLLSQVENSRNQRSALSNKCRRGHLLEGDNVQMNRSGDGLLRRRCRACVRMTGAAWARAQRAAIPPP